MSSILSFKQLLLKITSVSFFTSLLLLFTSLILAKIMVPEDFGKYSYFQSYLVVLINIFPLATSLSLSLQLYKSKKDKSNRVINNTLFTIFPIMMLLCVGIIFCLSFIIDLDITFYPILFNTLLMAFMSASSLDWA